MKCVICHGDDIQMKTVCEDLCRGDDISRFPLHIPVCANCGERYYDRHAMRRFERIREKVKGEEVSLREVGKVLICEC